MSCLMLAELSLSDQAAVAASFAAAIERKYLAMVSPLDPPAKKPFHPCTAQPLPGAGGSIPFPTMEPAA